MDDMAKSRSELVEEIGRMYRSRDRIRLAGLELLQEQTRTTTLLRESPDAIVLCDDAGLIELMSRGAELLFGYDELDLLNRPLNSIISCPPEFAGDVPRYLTHLQEVHGDGIHPPLLEVYRHSAEKLLLSYTLSLVSVDELIDLPDLSRTGDYQAAMCIFHDVTSQKQAFNEMSAHHRNLERLLQEMRDELNAVKSDDSMTNLQSPAALEFILDELQGPLENIVDLAKGSASLEEAGQCPQLLQAVESIRHTAESLLRRLHLSM